MVVERIRERNIKGDDERRRKRERQRERERETETETQREREIEKWLENINLVRCLHSRTISVIKLSQKLFEKSINHKAASEYPI